MSRLETLKPGDVLRISFGSRATQLAVVRDRTHAGNVRVMKFSQKRSVWKGPLRLHEHEIASVNNQSDLAIYAHIRATFPVPTKGDGRR